MYRVMLVDDEPLILAGIKTLIDWSVLGCELISSARNGQQALEIMLEQCPDIVIADINMPVMDGMALLKQAEQLYPAAVFIMLTNLQEFELVRQSLRYKAVDYLIKTQLDSETLTAAIEKAKQEAAHRYHLRQHALEATVQTMDQLQALKESIHLLMASPEPSGEVTETFRHSGVLAGYRMLNVLFTYPNEPAPNEHEPLFKWETEVVDTLIKTCFSRAISTTQGAQHPGIYILVWQSLDAWDEQLNSFYKKLQGACGNLTGAIPSLLVSACHQGKESLALCRRELLLMQETFYLTSATFIVYGSNPILADSPLGLKGLLGSFQKELNAKNAAGCAALLGRAIHRISDTNHEKAQAIWLCTELYFATCETIKEWPDALAREGLFSNSAIGYEQIRYLATRADVIRFLSSLSNELQAILQPNDSRHSTIIRQAKTYIHENIEKRILLNDVAAKVFLSPGYLSALFKKQCGESLIDYVNRHKVEAACQLLKQKDLMISQASDQLSFENAYYFARVFKRYTGMTPSEYQSRDR